MLKNISGKVVDEVPYRDEFDKKTKELSKIEKDAIIDRIKKDLHDRFKEFD